MLKILEAKSIAPCQILLEFSDGSQCIWSAENLLATRTGTLLEPLRDINYFQRFFLDAGALCWANGLEFSPERIYEDSVPKDNVKIKKTTPPPPFTGRVKELGNVMSIG